MKFTTKNGLLFLVCLFQFSILQAQVQVGTDIDGFGNEHTGFAISFSSEGKRVAIGAPMNYGNGLSAGHVRVFDLVNGDWEQIGQTIEGEEEIDNAGYSVSLSADGGRVAIGSSGSTQSTSGTSQVQVYDLVNGVWVQIGEDIEEEEMDEAFGYSVSLSADGSRMAVGAPERDINGSSNVGQVRVYDLINGVWTQIGEDINGVGEDAELGTSVALSADGNRMVVVAPWSSSIDNGGYLRAYAWSGNSWIQAGSTIAGGEFSADFVQGDMSFSADGNTLAYSSPYNDGWSGEVRVFKWTNGDWSQVGDNISGQDDFFGTSIALSADGSRIAVGAEETAGNGDDAGSLRVYELVGNDWVQFGEDVDGEAAEDRCGFRVALSLDGTRAAVSSRNNDGGGQDGGHTRIYDYLCQTVTTTDEISTCEAYTWIDGNTYTTSNNTATHTLTGSLGCDSIINLDLSINSINVAVTDDSPTLSANMTGADYQWLDCDNDFSILPGETDQNFTATVVGNYAVMISKEACVDTSECYLVDVVGVFDNDFEKTINVFPNPTNQTVNIDFGEYYRDVRIIVRNTLGRIIQKVDYDLAASASIDIIERGIYFLEVEVANGKRAVFRGIRY